jgi:hypothetical protein
LPLLNPDNKEFNRQKRWLHLYNQKKRERERKRPPWCKINIFRLFFFFYRRRMKKKTVPPEILNRIDPLCTQTHPHTK